MSQDETKPMTLPLGVCWCDGLCDGVIDAFRSIKKRSFSQRLLEVCESKPQLFLFLAEVWLAPGAIISQPERRQASILAAPD